MVISQQELDLILNPKIRRRTLAIPIKRGPMGELKRPPKQGGVHKLKVAVPYARYREECQSQPTRARAVLTLIARCDRPSKDVTITILTKPVREIKDGVDVWSFTFEKGDHAALQDRPVYLAKTGDFTFTASRQAVPGDPEMLTPFTKDLERARQKALERRVSPERAMLKREAANAGELLRAMRSMKARELVRRAQRNYEAAERLLSEEDVSSDTSAAVAGSQGEADRPHRGTLLATPEAA